MSKREFEEFAEMHNDSEERVYELFLSEGRDGYYVDGITRTAIAAFKAGQKSRADVYTAPDGYKIAPIESTSSMDLAAEEIHFDPFVDRHLAEAVWPAIIAASPKVEQGR